MIRAATVICFHCCVIFHWPRISFSCRGGFRSFPVFCYTKECAIKFLQCGSWRICPRISLSKTAGPSVCVYVTHVLFLHNWHTVQPLESGMHLMELMASHVQSTYWIPSVPEWGLKDPSTLWTTISILPLLHFLLDKAAKEHNWTWMSSSWKNYQRCRNNNGNTVRNSLVVQWLGLCTSTARGTRDWTKLLSAAKNKQTKKDGDTVKVEQSSGGWPRCAVLTTSLHQWMSGNWNSQGTNTQ